MTVSAISDQIDMKDIIQTCLVLHTSTLLYPVSLFYPGSKKSKYKYTDHQVRNPNTNTQIFLVTKLFVFHSPKFSYFLALLFLLPLHFVTSLQ